MATIQFENGTTVEFDGDPTPDDIEEVANSLGLKGGSQDQTLPNLDATEAKISSREDLIPQAFSEIKNNPTSMKASLQLLGGITQRGEASIANPAIEIQKGNFGGALDSSMQAVTGQRQAQFGDLIRNTGWGGKYNEPLAVATGMLAMAGVDKLTGGAVSKLVKQTAKEGAAVAKSIPEALDVEKQVYKLREASDSTTQKARDVVKEYSKDLSQRYGKEYEKAIGDAEINIRDYANALEKTAEEAGILGRDTATLSSAEKKILAHLEDIKEQIPKDNPIDTLLNRKEPTQEVMKKVSELDADLKGLVGKAYGKEWGSGEHVLTLARKNIGDVITEGAPDLKIVKAKFAPELQMKHEAIQTFQPYNRSGNFDTTRGANFLERAGKGNLKPDEKRFLDTLSNYKPGLLDEVMLSATALKNANIANDVLKVAGKVAGGAGALEIFRRFSG